jgi:hypothetical protein
MMPLPRKRKGELADMPNEMVIFAVLGTKSATDRVAED